MALKLYYGDCLDESTTRVTLVPTYTENRGNGAALNKLMSTKFPATALLMEMSSHLKQKKIKAVVDWTPRRSGSPRERRYYRLQPRHGDEAEGGGTAVDPVAASVGDWSRGGERAQEDQGCGSASEPGERGETTET